MGEQRRLIINADDFGISRGVNVGIVEAAQSGGVTSTSLMVNLPDSSDAVGRVRQCSNISVGLHFNITVGNALTGASSLTQGRSGAFYPLARLVAAASLGMIDESDVERECLAQIDRMTRAGFPPTHLDSHRHVHVHPAIYRGVLRAARTRGIPHVRVPREPLRLNAGALGATMKKSLLLMTAGRASRGVAGFVGISLQGGTTAFATRLFALIRELPVGTTELMTHPGYADDDLARRDSYTIERETELEVLCSNELREQLEASNVILTNFGDQSSITARQHEFA